MFLGRFLHLLHSGKRNEYSTEKLQNLQLYLNYVSTMPKLKTKNSEVNCHSILLHNSKNESMS